MSAVIAPRPPPRPPALGQALRSPAVRTGAAVAGITAAAAALRWWGLTRQGLWYDEAITAWLVRGTPGQLLSAIPHTESTPPLYYLLTWGWARVFGNTEAGLRSLSALAGTGAVPVAFMAARELGSRRAGLLAALLIAVNPLLVWYSQETRAYALLVLLAGASFWLFARARSQPTASRLVAWGVVSAAALCTHYFAAFVVAPEALLLFVQRGAPLRWRLIAVGIVGATAAGLAGLAWAQHGHAHWQGTFGLGLRSVQMAAQLFAGFTPPATLPAAGAIAVAMLVLVLLVARWGSRAERVRAATAATVAGAAVAIPLALAVVGIDYVNTRNCIGALVPIAVVLGVGAATRRAGVAGLVAVGVIVAVSTALVLEVPREPAAQRPHWRAVAAALSAPRAARRAILITGSATWAVPLAHYLPHTWFAGPSGVRVSQIEVLRRLPVRPGCVGRSWWGASCAIRPRPALAAPPSPGFRFASERRVAGFAIDTYRARRPIRLYARPPLDVPQPGAHGGRKLLFSPERVPRLPY
ncbi:MAG: mannosyltransferase [Thermoleophilaceae bacterium]|nr:mannosyltransferase [Thermoleophilaceae bacterium]